MPYRNYFSLDLSSVRQLAVDLEIILSVPESEFTERMTKVREKMTRVGLDAMLIYSYKSNAIRYLCNYSPRYSVTDSALLILPLSGDPVILTRLPMHLEEARKASCIKDVRASVDSSGGAGSLARMAGDCRDILESGHAADGKIGLVGYEPEMGISMPLRRELPKATFVDANDIMDGLRMIKSRNEIEAMRKAAEMADHSYGAALKAMGNGSTDYEVMASAEYSMRSKGASGIHSFLGVCIKDKILMQPSGRKISKGDIYFVEVIPEYEGYWVERVSNVAVGRPPPEWGRVFKAVEAAYKEVLQVMKPGMRICDLVRSVADLVQRAGFEKFEYRLGHGSGLDNIERPEYLSETDTTVIKPGMVLSLHPSIVVPGLCGSMLGGVFVVTDAGLDPLSRIEPCIPVI